MPLLTTAATFAGKFALDAAPKILDSLIGNDAANRQRAQARDELRLSQFQAQSKLLRNFDSAFRGVDAYNKALVAEHNNRVQTYQLNVNLLEREEQYAYQMAQLQAGSEVAGFLEENLDLLTSYVQNSGTLAASGMGTAAAKLSELKNYTGGYLRARRRLQGNAEKTVSGILRDIDRIEMQGNAQRAAMYQQVKDKPTLREYPTMPALPSFKVPSSMKSRGLSFGDLAPGLATSAISAAGASGLFSGLKFGGGSSSGIGSSGFTTDFGIDTDQFLLN